MNRTLWAIQALLALLFLFTGSMKLTLPIAELTQQIHLPGLFLRVLGVLEILGAAGLVLPGLLHIRAALTPLAALCLVPIMIGATALTAAAGLGGSAIVPLVTGLLAFFVAYGRSRPSTFRVERSAALQAPPEQVYPLINDFHQWSSWSPWERRDPGMRKTHSGADSGRGAIYQWSGNNQVGEGRMEIVEASAPSKVTIKLDFIKPFEGRQTAEFTLAANGTGSTVTWAAYGATNYLSQLMSVFVSMDALIGKDFEAGLANLRALTEPATIR
jgi:hypothetical protein